ncbi:MAG: DUF2721 domain-containing protein [Armatimonadota bacterium]|nr:DUF2721 domain-containing protein [Armatimonadota bacterium]
MPILADNPFTSLSLIAAPAVLTNASSVLALGTSNRFARAIDRARALSLLLEKEQVTDDPMTIMRVRQLNRLERRSLLLLYALRVFYLSLGSFAASGLISLVGASVASSPHQILFRITLGIGLITGTVGVGGLVFGCSILVAETRLAVQNVSEEATLVRERFKDYLTASEKAGEPG